VVHDRDSFPVASSDTKPQQQIKPHNESSINSGINPAFNQSNQME
jgi:hypothetical protein